jgi:transcriptional regulator with XRE-family HTH domain
MTRSTHHPRYLAFLEALRAERKTNGITQVQVAAALGNRQTFVSKLENGDRRLDVVELLEYLEAIGSDPTVFVSKLMKKLGPTRKKQDRKLAIRKSKKDA